MTSIDNTGFQVCGNCACPGFVPAITWAWDVSAKELTITDASDFPTGDDLGAVNVTASDGQGHSVSGRFTAAAGNVVLDMSTNGVVMGPGGFNISATVVTDKRCAANLSVFNIPIAADGTGSLGNVNNEGDVGLP